MVATGTVPKVLGPAISTRAWSPRKTGHRRWHSRAYFANGAANPLWRAPRIHGELKMLGIVISERTVSRVLRTIRSRPPSQTWKTFLRNHLGEIVSVDFFTVPTVRLGVLFVCLVLEHRRREVLHFNATDHPTSEWVSQQNGRGIR